MDCTRYIRHSYPIDFNDEKVLTDPISHTVVDGIEYFLLNHPDYIQHILQNPGDNYKKADMFYRTLRTMVGRGVLTSEGTMWERQRKSLIPAFGKQIIDDLIAKVSEVTLRYINSIDEHLEIDQSIDIHHTLMSLTMHVFCDAMFTIKLTNAQSDAILEAEKILGQLSSTIACMEDADKNSNNKTYVQYEKNLKILDDFAYDIIQDRKTSSIEYNDLLQLLMNSQQKNAEITDLELRDQIITLLIAGHETCGNTLTWACYLLSQNKKIEEKLRTDVKNAIGNRKFELNDFQKVSWPQLVFKEALRMFPPGYLISRTPVNDDMIGGNRIPANSIVVISPWVTHHNEKYWENPFTFNPARFSGNVRFGPIYIPFWGGARVCMGKSFAMREGPIILASLAKRYSFDLSSNQLVEAYGEITLRPRFPFNLTLTKVE